MGDATAIPLSLSLKPHTHSERRSKSMPLFAPLGRFAVIGGRGGREVIFCRFAIPISDWGNFFLSPTRPPRFKSERELNIVVCKQQWREGLFFVSKMHDKQGQRFSVKALKFFSHYNFGEHLQTASLLRFLRRRRRPFSMDFLHRGIPDHPSLIGWSEGRTFSEF